MACDHPDHRRLIAKVQRQGDQGCWIWLGSRYRDGYGQAWFNRQNWRAHRAFFVMLKGAIPSGRQLDHLCRNRLCVNPAHLEPVTCLENNRRGDGGKRNREKTHCPRGHSYARTAYITKAGTRSCRACHASREREARKVAKAAPLLPPPGERTHCPNGHSYAEHGRIWQKPGGGYERHCRACDRQRQRARYRAGKADGLMPAKSTAVRRA